MPLHLFREGRLPMGEAAEVIRQHNITLLPANLIRHARTTFYYSPSTSLHPYFSDCASPLPFCLPIQ